MYPTRKIILFNIYFRILVKKSYICNYTCNVMEIDRILKYTKRFDQILTHEQ